MPKTPFHDYHASNEVPFPQVVSVWCVNISGAKLTNGWGATDSDSDFDSNDSDSDDFDDSMPEKKKLARKRSYNDFLSKKKVVGEKKE